jgi:hypothetical protein
MLTVEQLEAGLKTSSEGPGYRVQTYQWGPFTFMVEEGSVSRTGCLILADYTGSVQIVKISHATKTVVNESLGPFRVQMSGGSEARSEVIRILVEHVAQLDPAQLQNAADFLLKEKSPEGVRKPALTRVLEDDD